MIGAERSVIHLVSSNQRRGAETYAYSLVRVLRQAGIKIQKVIVLDDTAGALEFRSLVSEYKALNKVRYRALAEIREIVRENPGALFYCHGGHMAKLLALATIGLFGNRYVVLRKIGMTGDWIAGRSYFRWIFHCWIHRQADIVLCLGPKARAELEKKLKVPHERIMTVDNFVDPEPFQNAAHWAEDRRTIKPIQFVSVGALSSEKNNLLMLQAIKGLVDAGVDAHLYLVGDGPRRQWLETWCMNNGISEYVEFAGVVDDVPSFLRRAHVFLLSSQTEGVPGALIEAGYAGLPAVCWNVGDVSAVVNSQTAINVAYGDEAAFIQAVKYIAKIPTSEREQMGRRAREHCLSRFTQARMLEQHERLFRSLGVLEEERLS